MAIIIAEPAGGGSWDACLVRIIPQRARRTIRLQYFTADCGSGLESLSDLGRHILQQTQTEQIESVLLLSNEHRFEGPAVIIHDSCPVPIQRIDPSSVLEQILPATWNSFLLIDLRAPEEAVLMKRNGTGAPVPAVTVPTFGRRFGAYLATLRDQGNDRTNNRRGSRSLSPNSSGLGQWLEAASLFGVTRILVRNSLSESGLKWRDALTALHPGGKKSPKITFLSPRDIALGALKSWHSGDAGHRAVVISELECSTALTMSFHRTICYDVVHPMRPVLDLQENSLARMVNSRPVLIVIDNNVQQLFGSRIKTYADLHLKSLGTTVVVGSEQRKAWDQVQNVCSSAVQAGLPREGVIVAFGGGVTLDVAGTAASLFRRGVPYLRVPTTLVGMVDTAVGIKQGFNFMARKNLLGSFYPPIGVINDSTFLAGLPQAELSSGMAEIIKMAVVRDCDLMELLERNAALLLQNHFQSPPDLARRVLIRAEQLMMQELQPNLFEACQARLADFGHTFSASLERVSGYTMRHGHAVALDMLISTGIAIRRGLCSQTVFDRMVRLYSRVGLPLRSPLATIDVLLGGARDACLHRSGNLNLVVPLNFGRAVYLQDVKHEDLEYSLSMMEQVADAAGSSKSSSCRLRPGRYLS